MSSFLYRSCVGGHTLTAELRAAVAAVEAKYDANVYVYSASIDSAGFGQLVTEVAEKKKKDPRKRGLLILTTHGGACKQRLPNCPPYAANIRGVYPFHAQRV